MAAAWAAVLRRKADPIPPGFYTRDQLCGMVGLAKDAARRHIRAAVAEGLVETKIWRDERGFPRTVYRLKSLDTRG